MSVLIEALTLVVPKQVLDVSYPGGTDAYLQALLGLENPPRFVCHGDAHLVNVSFYDPEHLEPATALLESCGLVVVDDGKFVEMAYVDQRFGPTMPCPWLEWVTRSEGFTVAWKSGTEPGDMAAPEDWTAEQSRALTRKDMRDEAGRCLKLGDEDGLETWLDFQTGSLIQGLAQREAEGESWLQSAEEPVVGAGTALIDVVTSALDLRGWEYDRRGDDVVTTGVTGERSRYGVTVLTSEQFQVVTGLCFFPTKVPEKRRKRVAVLLNRLNWDLTVGCVEMDESDGEMRCRTSIDAEGGELVEKMVGNVIDSLVGTAERVHDEIMAAAFGTG